MAKNDAFRVAMGHWANESVPRDLAGVARIAIQDTAELVDEATPIDTGFLVGNWQPTLNAPALGTVDSASGYEPSKISMVVADLQLGDAFFYSNNAVYARRINYGFVGPDKLGRVYNQQGRHMIEGAIAQWPLTVRNAAAQMRAA